MLLQLAIRDFVIVDRLELEFSTGFGAFTGETGAGKSLLVDALAFVLGERADPAVIRSGGERAEVSACFLLAEGGDALAWLRENALDDGSEAILRRTVDGSGRSRAWINGSAATVQQLRGLAACLIDIHGQHAHQSLVKSDAQRRLLDAHAGIDAEVAALAAAWRTLAAAEKALAAATANAEERDQKRAELSWEIAEIEALASDGAAFCRAVWEELNAEERRLGHAAGLIDGAQFALAELADSDESAKERLGAAGSRLANLAEYDPALAEVAALLASAEAELGEAVSALRRYADRLELDPARLAECGSRIEAVLAVARRLRVRPEELPERLEKARAAHAALDAAADTAALSAALSAAQADYAARAAAVTQQRRRAADELSAAVSRLMQDLALAGGSFQVALLPLAEGGAHGQETVEFRIAGLSGGEARPLAKVASGGELSRLGLAIQVVASRAQAVPTLIFDEVDVGIGGGVAELVGRLLARLGDGRQVLCVTHLPQVAACATWHWQVKKAPAGDGFVSRVTPLAAAERVEEIARMLGGVEITAITRQHAREMLAKNADG